MPPVLSARDLLIGWTHDEIRVVRRRPPDLEDQAGPRPAGARRLRPRARPPRAARRPPLRPDARPPAFPTLFGSAGDDAARPFVIDVDVVAEHVRVDLRLFGDAAIWADCCREALVESLDAGVSLRQGRRVRVRLEPLDVLMRRVAPPIPPRHLSRVRLDCLTPVAVRADQSLVARPAAILFAAVTRLARLAPWMGARLQHDAAGLWCCCEEACITAETLHPYRETRWSQRQRDRAIPVAGRLGGFTAEGRLGALGPYFQLANDTHLAGRLTHSGAGIVSSCFSDVGTKHSFWPPRPTPDQAGRR